MSIVNITVVAGLAGAGKTTWISQQVSEIGSSKGNILYFSPGTANLPIDQTRIAAEFPSVQVFHDGQEVEFFNQLVNSTAAFIELGFYLELDAIAQLLNYVPYRAIAILPPSLQDSEWHQWAQKIIPGVEVDTNIAPSNLWRSPTTGQVIDLASLHEFWYELTNGAYGEVSRAKGIFDVSDGRSLYADYVAGVESSDFRELNLPRHLEGRPDRFSGIEVLGNNLDQSAMRETLKDCCLSDAAILQSQEQVKEMLLEESTP